MTDGFRLRLSDDEWKQLKAVARASKVSVGKLLHKWIRCDLAECHRLNDEYRQISRGCTHMKAAE